MSDTLLPPSAPHENENQADEHTAKVSEMGYSVVGANNAGNEFDDSVTNYKPFGFDGNKKIEVDTLLGKHHAECKQDAIDGSRCANGGDADDGFVVHLHEADVVSSAKSPCIPLRQALVTSVIH